MEWAYSYNFKPLHRITDKEKTATKCTSQKTVLVTKNTHNDYMKT